MIRMYCYIILLSLAARGTVSWAQSPDFSGIKVMLNPGHGGHDSDDRGMPNGFWESEGNLTKGLVLRDLLQDRGCEVIMSRVENQTEDDLPLSQIAAIANENNVDLFLSIHSNAGTQSSNYPLTIFNGTSDNPANPKAKTWAQALWEQLITNQATYWTHINPHYMGDLTLNPDWTYGYGVLYPLQVPGIISEGSFHDYRPEMDRLLSLDYRKQEAYQMLYAMTTYFGLSGREPYGNISGIIRDSLLTKDDYSNAGSPDKYRTVNGSLVEILETGATCQVDTLNTGFFMFDSISPGDYHLVFGAKDYFSDTVPVAVHMHGFTYVNQWLRADKTMAPKIISRTPAGEDPIPCFDPVSFTFNMNMDSASVAEAFSIIPAMEGTFSWDKSYLHVTFQPSVPYETETRYEVSLDTTAQHQWGVNLDTSVHFTFLTGNRNRYLIESSFPNDGQEGVSPYLQFRVVFDAPLNNSSLIDAVTIVAEDGAGLSTKGATILTVDEKGHYYFSPESDLGFNKSYTLVVAGSVQDADNIPLVDTIRIGFSTMEEPGAITILDEFDDVDQWSIDSGASQGIDDSSFLYRWKKNYLSGSASMLVRYNFLSDQASLTFKPAEPLLLDSRSPDIGIWIWGDLGQNRIILGFDNGAEKELCQVDFAGWAYHLKALPEGAGSLIYIRLSVETGGTRTGDLYFDALHQPGITDFIRTDGSSSIHAYPNPVTGSILYLEGLPQKAFHYDIYSVNGTIAQTGRMDPGECSIELTASTMEQPFFIIHIFNEETEYSMRITAPVGK